MSRRHFVLPAFGILTSLASSVTQPRVDLRAQQEHEREYGANNKVADHVTRIPSQSLAVHRSILVCVSPARRNQFFSYCSITESESAPKIWVRQPSIFECDIVAELFEAVDIIAFQALRLQAVEKVAAEVGVSLRRL